ncbi:hypothetical protein L873DRAFT_1815673 [Choiromyces venosus 120613-1]|uniref:Uncharacterized protein n=1 Tax=Choiromyces venosus 120613-1 TaxID=1336337 RepID=A0A3N4J911_9PEZI|nr:hypothetical protein L873DRAFT_1815673 [Choiromyces venosus 120613-1]
MQDLEDDISELSSIASYPSSPWSTSQIPLDHMSNISLINIDDDDVNHILSSLSPGLISTLTQLQKRKQSTTHSWV